MREPYKLIQLYLSQRLTDNEMATLSAWIAADPEHARIFARHCVLHSSIRNHLQEEDLKVTLQLYGESQSPDTNNSLADTDAIGRELILDTGQSEDEGTISMIKVRAERQLQAFLAEQEQLRHEQQALQLRGRFGLNEWCEYLRDVTGRIATLMTGGARNFVRAWIFASIVLLLVLVIHGQYHQRVVATIVQEVDTVWAYTPKSRLLRPGRLELKKGHAQLQLKNNVEILIEAPCEFRLRSLKKLSLTEGVLTAKVPPQVHGFTVKTPSAKVVDRGTEFGVRVGRSGSTLTAVFDGRIQLSGAHKSRESRERSVLVVENQQAQTSAAGKLTGDVQTLEWEHGFLRTWQEVLYRPRVSGQCQVLAQKPTSLELDELESSSHVFVFLEQANLRLASDWGVATILPGPIDLKSDPNFYDVITAQTRMDCYMIHFDPETSLDGEIERSQCRATIGFPRPILGLITTTDRLIQSDPLFGDPSIAYPTGNRGIEPGTEKKPQQITISKDLKSLNLDLAAGKHIDQIRVLIAAADMSYEK